ncbi:hypothetical protein ZWY2020_010386 [Hordeum vulgare]|nr:hypothetical protein ZWY2020_010386 [Hordeum vulgare]
MVSASTVLTLLGFCASVLFIVFVCSRLVCALTRRVRRGRRPSPPLPRFPPVAVRAGHSFHVPLDRLGHTAGGGGVDPAAVAAFPTRAFSAAGCPRGDAADASAIGHSPTTSPQVLANEPGQANQIQVVCHPSGGSWIQSAPSEVGSPGENNNQTVKLNIEGPGARSMLP